MKIVDTHQHLWDKDLFHYAWLEPLPVLDRSFRLSDYSEGTRGLEIAKTVFVECDVDEAQMLDEASGRPEKENFKQHLDKLAGHPKLKGIRRILHTHPDELGEGRLFIENVARLATYGLS